MAEFSFIVRFLFLIISIFFITSLSAQQQRGVASFYAKRATGARTSSGEKLHHDSMTCAHKTFPFGTRLRVTCPATGRSVVVRVSDRGPFIKGRIIDLSWGAARELGILNMGVASVLVEKVQPQTNLGPVKKQEPFEMPEFDFVVNDAGFLFLPEVQKNEIQQDELPVKKGQRQLRKQAEKVQQKQSKSKEKPKKSTEEKHQQEGTSLHPKAENIWKKIFSW